jgi:hypothetical protein
MKTLVLLLGLCACGGQDALMESPQAAEKADLNSPETQELRKLFDVGPDGPSLERLAQQPAVLAKDVERLTKSRLFDRVEVKRFTANGKRWFVIVGAVLPDGVQKGKYYHYLATERGDHQASVLIDYNQPPFQRADGTMSRLQWAEWPNEPKN